MRHFFFVREAVKTTTPSLISKNKEEHYPLLATYLTETSADPKKHIDFRKVIRLEDIWRFFVPGNIQLNGRIDKEKIDKIIDKYFNYTGKPINPYTISLEQFYKTFLCGPFVQYDINHEKFMRTYTYSLFDNPLFNLIKQYPLPITDKELILLSLNEILFLDKTLLAHSLSAFNTLYQAFYFSLEEYSLSLEWIEKFNSALYATKKTNSFLYRENNYLQQVCAHNMTEEGLKHIFFNENLRFFIFEHNEKDNRNNHFFSLKAPRYQELFCSNDNTQFLQLATQLKQRDIPIWFTCTLRGENLLKKKLEEYLTTFLKKISECYSLDENLLAIIQFIKEFIQLQPFTKYNEKTSILLLNHLLMTHGFPLTIMDDPRDFIALSDIELVLKVKMGMENCLTLIAHKELFSLSHKNITDFLSNHSNPVLKTLAEKFAAFMTENHKAFPRSSQSSISQRRLR